MAALVAHDAQRVAAVRRFNRLYTQHLGVLQDGWLQSPFTLAEARVLYELHQRRFTTATDIGRALGLDAGYLSRILAPLPQTRPDPQAVSPDDARQSLLSLTARGQKPTPPSRPGPSGRSARCSAGLNRRSRNGWSRRCARSRR
jgi:DNA-binding MarR family transcriptional regulator